MILATHKFNAEGPSAGINGKDSKFFDPKAREKARAQASSPLAFKDGFDRDPEAQSKGPKGGHYQDTVQVAKDIGDTLMIASGGLAVAGIATAVVLGTGGLAAPFAIMGVFCLGFGAFVKKVASS